MNTQRIGGEMEIKSETISAARLVATELRGYGTLQEGTATVKEHEKRRKIMEKIIENNQVVICGKVIGKFEYNHEIYGEKFYMAKVQVERLSGASDTIPVLFSERLIDINQDYSERTIRIAGQFRSWNKRREARNKLILCVFAREIDSQEETEPHNTNNAVVEGYLCKTANCRKTPLGREITDMLIAVNRAYGKSDYLPCICWGRNANYAAGLKIGTHIRLSGRIQSREYDKKLDENRIERNTAYEMSVNKMEVLN